MVVGVDGTADSLAALSLAAELAAQSGTGLVVVHVRPECVLVAANAALTSAGQVRHRLVDAILADVPAELVIWEGRRREQQVWFIRRVGRDVNLGNIAPDEVVALETLRLGLRADTIDFLSEASTVDSAAPDPETGAGAAASLARRDPAFDELEPPVLVTVACPGCGWERMTMAHDAAGVARASLCPHCGTGTRLVRRAGVRRPVCACCC